MSTYTVQFANQLEGADQYGNITYSVKFTTEADSCLVRVQPTTTIQPGTVLEGTIESKISKAGKPYRQFKREASQSPTYLPTQKPYAKEDRSDGMKQGMCINNAAALVTGMILKDESKLANMTPQDFAKNVTEYARELYKIDLTQLETTEPETAEEVVIQDIDNSPIDLSGIPF